MARKVKDALVQEKIENEDAKINNAENEIEFADKEVKEEKPTFIQSLKSVGSIRVRPLVDSNKSRMGLENYDMVLFPNTYHEEQVAAIERNGVTRFVTGLDEFAPEVQNIRDKEEKEATIKKIRNVVSYLEQRLGANVVDENDPNFWSKVKTVNPNNKDFWSKLTIRVGNIPLVLTPLEDPFDLLKLMAIEAGGFSIVAKSYEDAMAMDHHPDFYLDKENTAITIRTNYKKLRNKAIALLDGFTGKRKNKMFYLCKVLDNNSAGLSINSSEDEFYDILDEFINGNGAEKDKTRAAEIFIETAKLEESTLKLKALAKDAQFYKFIIGKPDGMLYHSKSSAMMGRNTSDIVSYLQNPLNQEILEKILDEIDSYWDF